MVCFDSYYKHENKIKWNGRYEWVKQKIYSCLPVSIETSWPKCRIAKRYSKPYESWNPVVKTWARNATPQTIQPYMFWKVKKKTKNLMRIQLSNEF